MIKILELAIDQYWLYRNKVLGGIGIIFLCIIIGGIFRCKENRKYTVNKLLQRFVFTIGFIAIGSILYLLGVTMPIEYVYFNVIVFAFAMGIIIINGTVQMVMFRKIVSPMAQGFKYIQYILFFQLFLLAATYRLEFMEWIVGMLAILCCQLVIFAIGKSKAEEIEISKESDYPNPNLYFTREKQLEKFVAILEQQKSEPYAVMISGEWGSGKSSFAKALEIKLKKDDFIWVRAGSEKSVSDIMLDIAEKVLEKLKINNVYIESSDLIEKYFVAFSDLLEESGLKFFNKISSLFGIVKTEDSKDYLNGKLNELGKLNKTIYLIIDDLDRCDKDYQIKMFNVIRESTELVNCKTIFLVDQNRFLDDEHNANYIEKYISYTLDLCKVSCQELLEYHVGEFLDNDFFDGLDEILLKNRTIAELRSLVGGYLKNVVEILNSELNKAKEEFEKAKEKIEKKGETEKETERQHVKDKEDKVEDIKNTVIEIEKNISNSRKVKNYLKGVKRDISNLNADIGRCSGEFRSEDWIRGIIEVQFVKNILPELFTEIKMCSCIEEFGEKYKGYSLDIIWGVYLGLWLNSEKKVAILNNIIYNLDVIDFLHIKTLREKYIEELYSGKADIKNVNQYVECAQSYDDLHRIMEVCETKNFDKNTDKERFSGNILKILSNQWSPFKTYEKEFLDFSKHLVDWAVKSGMSEKERRIYAQEGYLIVRRCIIDNALQFKKVLSIFFPVSRVQEIWHGVSDINEFYIGLKKIDKELLFKGLEDEEKKLWSIRGYYGNLEAELQKGNYKNAGIDTEKIFININLLFELCQFWDEVENAIDLKEDGDIAKFNQYFDMYGYSVREMVFSSRRNLLCALLILRKYYENRSGCYKSDYSLFLLRLSYKVVLKFESEPEWFGDKSKEVYDILSEIYEIVHKLEVESDRDTKDTMDFIRIYLYKCKIYFEQSCQSGSRE